MKQSPAIAALDSFDALAGLPVRGERLAIAVADHESFRHLASYVETSFVHSRNIVFISPDLTESKSSRAVLGLIRRKVRGSAKAIPLIVLAGPLPAWLRSAPARRRFFDGLAGTCSRLSKGSCWILDASELAPADLAELKDETEYFFDLRLKDDRLVGQFIAAKGIAEPAFYFPRQVTLSENSFELGEPINFAVPSDTGLKDVQLADRAGKFLLDSGDTGVIVFDATGTVLMMNRRARELAGSRAKEMYTTSPLALVPQESRRRLLRAFAEARRERAATFEIQIQRHTRTLSLHVGLNALRKGLYIARIDDASERARLADQRREVEARLRQLMHDSPLPQAIFVAGKLAEANASFRKALMYSTSEADKAVTLREFLGKENAGLVKELQTLVSGETIPAPLVREIHLEGDADRWQDLEVSFTPVVEEGRIGWHALFVDLTDRKRHLRSLEQSEAYYRHLVETSAGAVCVVREGKLTFVSKGFLELFGYMLREDITGRELTDSVASRDRKQVQELLSPGSGRATNVTQFEFTGIRKDGTRITVHAQAGTLPGEGNASVLYLADRTAPAKAYDDTRRRNKELESIAQISASFHRTLDVDEVLTTGLEGLLKLLDCPSGGVYEIDHDAVGLTLRIQNGLPSKIVETLGHQNMNEGVTGWVAKTLEPLILTPATYPPHLPYRSLFESEQIAMAVYMPLMARESLIGIALICSTTPLDGATLTNSLLLDLGRHLGTALENAHLHARVRTSETRYRTAVEAVTDVVYQTAPNGNILLIGPQVERLLSHKPAEFTRNPELWRMLVHPDDRSRYSERMSGQATGQENFEITYRILPRGKATYRWVRDAIRYVRDSDGTVVSTYGIVSDITERIEAARSLEWSEALKGNVLEAVQEGVAVYDAEFRYEEWNKSMERITGISAERVLGKSAFAVAPEIAHLREALERARAGEDVSAEDLSFVRPDTGLTRLLSGRYSPLRDRDGKTVGVVGTVVDVTEQKRLERDVYESEATLRNVVDAMGDALIISDLEGKIWEVNNEFSNLTGYSRNEVRGKPFPYPWVIDEQMATFVTWISELREKQYLRDFDMTWRRKDGREVAISLNTSLLRNAQGEPMAMLNIARDISERRRLANELERTSRQIKQRNKELLGLNTISSSIIKSLDLDEVLDVASEETKDIMNADATLCYLRDNQTRKLHLERHRGIEDDVAADIVEVEVLTARSASGARERRPLVLNGEEIDGPQVTPLARHMFHRLGMASLVAISLQSKNRVLGALVVAFHETHAFPDQELHFLTLIGNQLGAAIENAQLYAEVRSQVQRITALYEMGRSLTGALDTKTLFEVMHREVARSLPYDLFAFDWYDARKGTMRRLFEVHQGEKSAPQGGPVEKETQVGEDSIFWDVIHKKETYIGSIAGGGSVIAVPVQSKKATVGVLSLHRSAPGVFSGIHLRLFESIANLVEIALDRVMLYEDTVAKSAEIENRNRELDDFAYVVSHDLKEPLITIEGYSKILLSDFAPALQGESREFLTSIVQSSGRMKNLIDDLLTLSRIGRVQESLETVRVGAVIEELLQEFEFTLRERHGSIHYPPNLPEVKYDPTQLSVVFRNVIANGLKFNTSPEPRIDIGFVENEAEYVFSVKDNGIGIPKEHFDKIFVIFQRLHRSEEYRGTGAGLTIVKKIVETHKGRIWLESVEGEGTVFFFSVKKSEEGD